MQTLCQRALCHLFGTSKHAPKCFSASFREVQGTGSENLVSFMQQSRQGNNADVNPSNLEMKQNSSRTVDWLCVFLHIFQIFKTSSSTGYKFYGFPV